MLLGLTGAGMVAYAAYGLWKNTAINTLKRMTQTYFESCQCKEMEQVRIRSVGKIENGFRMEVLLPMGMTVEKFDAHTKGLELATSSTVVLKHVYGRIVEMRFGYAPFREKMNYSESLLNTDSLAIPLYTPFGLKHLDFRDEANCHLLQGGATRMGKSVFLRLLVTHLTRTMNGKVKFLLIDNKVTDLWMFQNIPHIQIAETQAEANVFLKDVLDEVERRKELLKSKKDVVDLKELRQKYPREAVDPIFVVIDEYGRFSEDEAFQNKVTELAETAGYVDVHLIISAQRPDASTVLKGRIRANLVTRMAFTTADEKNSEIIIHVPDAAHLGRIQGRAILFDGFPMKVQVPYISADQAKALLAAFYAPDETEQEGEETHDSDDERQDDTENAEALPRFNPRPVRSLDVS